MKYLSLVALCLISSSYVMCVDGNDTAMDQKLLVDVLTYDAYSGHLRSELVNNLDTTARAQLQEKLESSIAELKVQLLTPLQISLIKATCLFSLAGVCASIGGYLYSLTRLSPSVNGYLLASLNNEIHKEWLDTGTVAKSIGGDYVNKEIVHDTALMSTYKTKMLRSFGVLCGSITLYALGLGAITVATRALKNHEERKVVIANLEAALEEITVANDMSA